MPHAPSPIHGESRGTAEQGVTHTRPTLDSPPVSVGASPKFLVH